MRTHSLINLTGHEIADGEELVIHRFANGSIRMLLVSDYQSWQRAVERSTGNEGFTTNEIFHPMQSIKKLVTDFLAYYGFRREPLPSSRERTPVAEIPSGALLRVFSISSDWQQQYHLGLFE